MTFDDAVLILADLIERMPKGYPRPRLIMHDSPEGMAEYVEGSLEAFMSGHQYHGRLVLAFADHEKNRIHIQRGLLDEETATVQWKLLHEMGHLRQAQRHGTKPGGPFFDERKAEDFARRWSKKLDGES